MPKRQFLFCVVFGFRNPTQEIFSELDETNAQGLIFPRSFQKTEEDTKWGDEAPTPQGGAAKGGRAALWCGAPVPPLTLPFRLLILSVAKTLLSRATIRKKFQRRRRRQSHLGGFRRSPPAPSRRGESSPGGLYITMIASGLMCE